ncbi:protein kinase domain containing protein [Stylonychia lemnae]|uniref:Protein kinase domain containing protein n=1 Tax=Stylonychia lemnae TaxID=5949 RepID=A0A078AWI5_STYLE|nr:protein kinase domain containing protein [Stylonychia lemnae]|eukprot:CDW86406.1 protein kinase domain containing protein [Stylonychia lemnae]
MEYANGGELFDYIVKRKRLQDKEACKFYQQLLSGIEYLHKIKVCHRDLKPENLLLDENKNIKIVDFGLSNTYKVGETLKTACGSPCYAAPEMIAGKRYHGLNADIWSSGVILYAMACGYLPFEDPNTNKLYKKILSCDYLIPGFISAGCKDLIKKILNTDPNTRLKTHEIRSHEWYGQIQSVEMEGIIVGADPIPIIDDIKQLIDEGTFSFEDVENTEKYIKNNKHNPITATYYLLMKKTERETGKNLVFERVTKEKRSYNSTGNLGQPQKNQLQQTVLYFRGNSQQIPNLNKAQMMNQTTMEGFKNNNQSKSESKTRSNRDNSFNIGTSEFFNNLNPVTKQYLKQIEKTYVNRNDSISTQNEDENRKVVIDKYKQFRDTVDVAKWIQNGYNKGQSAMNVTQNYDQSFMEQRLQRNAQSKDRQGNENRPTSNDNNKNYSVFQPSNNSFMRDGLPIVSQGGAVINGQKFNLSNMNSAKNQQNIEINQKKNKNKLQIQEVIDINNDYGTDVVNSSGPLSSNITQKAHQIKKNPESNFSMYTIYRPKVTNGLAQQNAMVNNHHSFINDRNDSILERKNDAVNNTVIEKGSHNKLLSELYSTSGKKFYNSNVPYNKLATATAQNQNLQVFNNNIILPFQVNSGIKTSTTKQQAQYSNQIMQKNNNDSVYNSTADTSVGGGGVGLNISNQQISTINGIKQINQNLLFNQKGDFRVKLANNNGIAINKKQHLNNRKILIL